jgi:hypothetical protein
MEPGINDLASLLKARDDGDSSGGIRYIFDFFFHGRQKKATRRWLVVGGN